MAQVKITKLAPEGLRYKSKKSGSPFAAQSSINSLSCLKCGKHKPRAEWTSNFASSSHSQPKPIPNPLSEKTIGCNAVVCHHKSVDNQILLIKLKLDISKFATYAARKLIFIMRGSSCCGVSKRGQRSGSRTANARCVWLSRSMARSKVASPMVFRTCLKLAATAGCKAARRAATCADTVSI